MKLDDLEKLAHAAQTERYLRLAHQQKFNDAANPQTIKELIALVRLQHEALKALSMKQARWTEEQIGALDAYERMNGGE